MNLTILSVDISGSSSFATILLSNQISRTRDSFLKARDANVKSAWTGRYSCDKWKDTVKSIIVM